jgi:hypothetical protein
MTLSRHHNTIWTWYRVNRYTLDRYITRDLCISHFVQNLSNLPQFYECLLPHHRTYAHRTPFALPFIPFAHPHTPHPPLYPTMSKTEQSFALLSSSNWGQWAEWPIWVPRSFGTMSMVSHQNPCLPSNAPTSAERQELADWHLKCAKASGEI